MSALHSDLSVTCSGCLETFPDIARFKRHRRTGRCGKGTIMRKVIGIILAGWPMAGLLILMLVAQYQNYGLKGAVLMLCAMIVTGGGVWLGLNLAFAPKGEGR